MTVTNRPVTAEDLFALPDDGKRHELIKGELTTIAPTGGGHGATVMTLAVPLGNHIQQRKLGVIFSAETGFIVARNPDTVRAPDIAFVAKDRIPSSGVPVKFVPLAPDLAVEVVSPNDTVYEVDEKVRDWLNAGTRLVWVVNPNRRIIEVHAPRQPSRMLTEAESLDGGNVVSGFTIALKDIFRVM